MVGPDSGDENVAVQVLGPTIDEDRKPAQQVTAGGVVFAYKKDTGEVLWARDNPVGLCLPGTALLSLRGIQRRKL